MQETWKNVVGYEGLYEISNHGRVKSLDKSWVAGKGRIFNKPETIRKPGLNSRGYLHVKLCKEGKRKIITIHTLVWDHFGNKPRNGHKLQVDHRDNNKLNNRIDNLQLLTPRQNVSKHYKTQKKTSRFTGVCWHKKANKWVACITLNKKIKHLGYFKYENDACLEYQKALREMIFKMGIINIIKNLIKKGTQTLACDDSGDYQTAQVSFLGQTHTVRQIVQYGLYGHSPTGSQWVIVNLRANSNDKMGIANDYTNRPKNLKEGEVVLYNTKTQTFIKLDKDGNITLSCTNLTGTVTEEITLDFTTADLTGDVNIIGDLDVTGVTNLYGGNITLTGGAVAIGPATTIDGKVFLNHTHSAGSYLDSVAGAVTGSSGGVN